MSYEIINTILLIIIVGLIFWEFNYKLPQLFNEYKNNIIQLTKTNIPIINKKKKRRVKILNEQDVGSLDDIHSILNDS